MSTSTSVPAEPSAIGRTFLALSVPAYRILWFGTLFSFLGMQMQMVARGYLAYDLTHRNAALGGVMIAFGVPQLVLSLVGGVVADRMAKRRVLVVWQVAIAIGSALLAVAIATDHVSYWMLIASGVINGAAFSFIGPARQAFIGDLVPTSMMGNAIVMQQVSMNGTNVVGPALAGALIAVPLVGIGGVYALTTLGFIVTVASLFFLPAGNPTPRTVQRSPLQDIFDGFRYVRRDRPVAILLLMSLIVVAVGFPYQGFLPSISSGQFGRGSGSLGLLSSLAAIGALTATLMVANLTTHRRAWLLQGVAGTAFGVVLIAFALAPSFWLALAIMLPLGVFSSSFQSMNNALTMTITDPRYYGRMQSLMGLGWSMFGIVSLPLGFVADAIGIRTTLVLMGMVVIAGLTGLRLLARAVDVERDIRRRTSTDGRRPLVAGDQPAPVAAATRTDQPVTARRA